MKYLVILTLLLAGNSFASDSVKLDMTLTMNGRISQPKVVVNYGKAATLVQKDAAGNGYEISVTPTEASMPGQTGKAIRMNFVISELKSNQKKVVSSPVVTSFMGHSATVGKKDPQGNVVFNLEILPKDVL